MLELSHDSFSLRRSSARNRPERRSLFSDATPLLDDPAGLRERAEQDGYLFFKHFLPLNP